MKHEKYGTKKSARGLDRLPSTRRSIESHRWKSLEIAVKPRAFSWKRKMNCLFRFFYMQKDENNAKDSSSHTHKHIRFWWKIHCIEYGARLTAVANSKHIDVRSTSYSSESFKETADDKSAQMIVKWPVRRSWRE